MAQVIYIAPWRIWRWMLQESFTLGGNTRAGIFRNSPGVIPGRWGFFILGFEFGSRQPGDRVGQWLKRVGLWPG